VIDELRSRDLPKASRGEQEDLLPVDAGDAVDRGVDRRDALDHLVIRDLHLQVEVQLACCECWRALTAAAATAHPFHEPAPGIGLGEELLPLVTGMHRFRLFVQEVDRAGDLRGVIPDVEVLDLPTAPEDDRNGVPRLNDLRDRFLQRFGDLIRAEAGELYLLEEDQERPLLALNRPLRGSGDADARVRVVGGVLREVRDRLRLAVLQDLEIVLGQATDAISFAVGDDDVDVDDGDLDGLAEARRFLREERKAAQQRCNDAFHSCSSTPTAMRATPNSFERSSSTPTDIR
jgi:hypothetical protein